MVGWVAISNWVMTVVVNKVGSLFVAVIFIFKWFIIDMNVFPTIIFTGVV